MQRQKFLGWTSLWSEVSEQMFNRVMDVNDMSAVLLPYLA